MKKSWELREITARMGVTVARAREALGLNREALARAIRDKHKIEVSGSYFYLLERGRRVMQVPDVLALAVQEVLQLDHAWLQDNAKLLSREEMWHFGAMAAGKVRHRRAMRERAANGDRTPAPRSRRRQDKQGELPLAEVRKAIVERLEGALKESDLRKAEAPQPQLPRPSNFWALALGVHPERTADGWVLRWGDLQGLGKSPGEALLLFERAMDQKS